MPEQTDPQLAALGEIAGTTRVAGQNLPHKARWEARYGWVVVAVDIVSILTSVAIGLLSYALSFGEPAVNALVGMVTIVGVVCALSLCRAWEPTVLGHGSEEFNRVGRALGASSILLALVGLAVSAPGTRPWVFGVIPIAGLLSVTGRYCVRRVIHRQRRLGRCGHRVLAVGSDDGIADLVYRTRREVHHGWVVTGACTPSGTTATGADEIGGVPIVGDLDGLRRTIVEGGYRIVAVAPSPGWSGERLRRLAWDLEGSSVDLVVHPGIVEVAGPRLHVTPVDGLPLLRLTQPAFTGVTLLAKALVDKVIALLIVVVLAPVLVAVAVAVALDGRSPLFIQERVGRNGVPFRMIKFRSMVPDAERLRDQLLDENHCDGPLFKVRDDPRQTRVGRWIRKYSIDELPQLLNVIAGSMSLVGPRPPLPDEVARYTPDAMRRLLVRPGLTGLWQVSGRSDLTWEESLRLDLRYVENWNFATDALIMWKTIGAVVGRDGAY